MSHEEKTLRVTRWPERVWVEKMRARGEVDERREFVPVDDVPEYASDGYHTVGDLYAHRAALTAALFNLANIACGDDIAAWKSKLHADGEHPFGKPELFVAGLSTPEGQITYHYDIDPWWDAFDVAELERAPEYDGHTPDDVVERLLALF